jgi:hypothetical protein
MYQFITDVQLPVWVIILILQGINLYRQEALSHSVIRLENLFIDHINRTRGKL